MTTPNLKLPEITESQAQKHVTHNIALQMLDVFARSYLDDIFLVTPPVSPSEGDAYFVGGGATGDWSANIGKIAHWLNGQWYFYDAPTGWTAWVEAQNRFFQYRSTGWESVFPLPIYTTASAPSAGDYYGAVVFTTDGNAGQPCLAASDGGAWKRIALGATIASS